MFNFYRDYDATVAVRIVQSRFTLVITSTKYEHH